MNKKLPYLLPVRSVIFFLVFMGISLVTGKQLEEIGHVWSILATVINIITIALLILIAHKNKQTYSCKGRKFREGFKRTVRRRIHYCINLKKLPSKTGPWMDNLIRKAEKETV